MDQDELFRTASENVSVRSNIDGWTTNDLLTALAMETEGQAKGHSTFRTLDAISEDELVRGPALVDLGKRIFRRWNSALHGFVCNPDSSDQELKDKVFRALTGAEGGIALLAGVLVSAFGLSLVTATLVATLVVKLFADTAGEEVCKWWGEHLDDVPT